MASRSRPAATSIDPDDADPGLLRQHRDVMAALAEWTLDEVLEPAGYLGASAVLTRRVVAESGKVLNQSSVPAS